MNTKQAFNKVKCLTGGMTTQKNCTTQDPTTLANTLNTFYKGFDSHDYSAACEELLGALPFQEQSHPPFTEEDVRQLLARCKPGKASGPDGILAKVLKLCAMELSPSFIPSSGNPIRHHLHPPSGKHPPSYRYPRHPTPHNQTTVDPLP